MGIDEDQLLRLLDIPIKNTGYNLLDIKLFNRNSDKIIQLFIYQPQGIEIDDCIKVNNLASEIIINEGLSLDNYTLEISSPGIFMKLYKPEHFKIFRGKRIKVKFLERIQGFKTATGKILKCTENGIRLKIFSSREDIHIPFSKIHKANLEPEINI